MDRKPGDIASFNAYFLGEVRANIRSFHWEEIHDCLDSFLGVVLVAGRAYYALPFEVAAFINVATLVEVANDHLDDNIDPMALVNQHTDVDTTHIPYVSDLDDVHTTFATSNDADTP